MKLENIKELNLPHYKHESFSSELTVGDIVAKAEISATDDAWEFGYAKKGNSYHFVFQQGISQTEDPQFPGSKDEPKDFLVYLVGIVDEGKTHKLAYASSKNGRIGHIHTLRLTRLDQITRIDKLVYS
jgi:hypothetical protein